MKNGFCQKVLLASVSCLLPLSVWATDSATIRTKHH